MVNFEAIFQQARNEKRQAVYKGEAIYLMDKIVISGNVRGIITLLKTNSDWQQAVMLHVDKKDRITINGFTGCLFKLWEDELLQPITFQANIKMNWLGVYNAWEHRMHNGQKATYFWLSGAAMKKEVINENEFIYYCNDGHFDDNFDDIVFKLTLFKDDSIDTKA